MEGNEVPVGSAVFANPGVSFEIGSGGGGGFTSGNFFSIGESTANWSTVNAAPEQGSIYMPSIYPESTVAQVQPTAAVETYAPTAAPNRIEVAQATTANPPQVQSEVAVVTPTVKAEVQTPVQDAAVKPTDTQPQPALAVPDAFKSTDSVKFETSRDMQIAADRPKISEEDTAPRVNVGPTDQIKNPDILVGKDGTVKLAQGIADGDKPLAQYDIAVEPGADAKAVAAALEQLHTMIMNKNSDATPVLRDDKNLAPQNIHELYKNDDPDPELNKPRPAPPRGNPSTPSDTTPHPKPDNAPDSSPDADESPDESAVDGTGTKGAGLKRMVADLKNVGEVNPVVYSNSMGGLMDLSEMQPPMSNPPTEADLKRLAAFLKEHKDKIADNMDKTAKSLAANGDEAGAKAMGDYKTNFLAAANDEKGAGLGDFAQKYASFMSKAQGGTAGPTDVLALTGSAEMTSALKNASIIQAARDATKTGADAEPDFSKLTSDQRSAIIAQLVVPGAKVNPSDTQPNPTVTVKNDTVPTRSDSSGQPSTGQSPDSDFLRRIRGSAVL